jgi:hypothetical protein
MRDCLQFKTSSSPGISTKFPTINGNRLKDRRGGEGSRNETRSREMRLSPLPFSLALFGF